MSDFREVRRVILAADLTGFTKAVHSMDALRLAELLDRWYRASAKSSPNTTAAS